MHYRRKFIKIIFICLLLILLTGCGDDKEVMLQPADMTGESIQSGSEYGSEQDFVEESVSAQPDRQENTEEIEPSDGQSEKQEEKMIQLMMLGDNLLHMGIVNTGKQSDGSYNYDFLFDDLTDFLAEAEIKMINQETILGGNELGFSGYPLFNSPTQVGEAMVKAGFNVVLHASNHAADKGINGLLSNVEFWKNYPEMTVAGIHEKEESAINIITIEGVDFAILNYTYSMNTSVLKKEVMGHLDMLCYYDEATGQMDFTTIHPKVLTDIAQARQMADVVIVCPHWGREYTTTPSPYQEKFALQMTEAGADIIIGTHPHVVQPVEWITADNGNRALCFYSLGNYVSTQKQALCMLEAMSWITFRVTENGVELDEDLTGVVPMVCHYTANPVRLESVYLLENYTEEQALAHGIWIYGGVELHLAQLKSWTEEVLGEYVLRVEEILEPPYESPKEILSGVRGGP